MGKKKRKKKSNEPAVKIENLLPPQVINPEVNPSVNNKEDEDIKLDPRPYQVRLTEIARKRNAIICLDTGTGKTFISVMIMESPEFKGPVLRDGKRIVFLVPTEALVYQQAEVIRRHTSYKVGTYCGATHRGNVLVDRWDRNLWQNEIDRHHVLVMVYVVFQNALQQCMAPIERFILLIFDEAHHAGRQDSNHPCRKILKFYREKKFKMHLEGKPLPRLVGLTASIINWKPSKTNDLKEQIAAQIREMEIAYDYAVCETSMISETIKEFAAKPEIRWAIYDDTLLCHRDVHLLRGFFSYFQDRIKTMEKDDMLKIAVPMNFTILFKMMSNVRAIFEEMGIWCGWQAIRYYFKDILETAEMLRDTFSVYSKFLTEVARILGIIGHKLNQRIGDRQMSNNLAELLSAKMNCLLEVLREQNTYNENNGRKLSCIIFVQQRAVTKILCCLLQEIAEFQPERYGFIRAGYVVGTSSQHYVPHEIMGRASHKAQQEILRKFRKEELNIIVATSVLEEGLDIKSCNIVIRYDKPETFREFLQSRGRARAKPAFYYMLVPKTEEREHLEHMKTLECTEDIMREICRERTARKYHDDKRFNTKIIAYSHTSNSTGATVDLETAPSLLNDYCQRLPSDTFTPLAPEYNEIRIKDGFLFEVRLPINCPIKELIEGYPCAQKKTARKAAALRAIQQLHSIGELNEFLVPVSKEKSIEKTLKEVGWEIDDSELRQFRQEQKRRLEQMKGKIPSLDEPEMFEPGTRKRWRVYQRPWASYLQLPDTTNHNSKPIVVYAYIIKYHSSAVGNEEFMSSEYHLGFLSYKEIPLKCIPRFPVFNKYGEIAIDLEPLGQIELDQAMIDKLMAFNRTIYHDVLHLCTDETMFEWGNAPVLLAILNHDYKISWPQIDQIMESREMSEKQEPVAGSIVILMYRCEQRAYLVERVCHELSPLSPFQTKGYKNYIEYFADRYGVTIQDHNQPLLEVKPLETFSQLRRIDHGQRRADKTPTNVLLLVPSLCVVLPLSYSLWLYLKCWPAIFYRMNQFLTIEERILQVVLRESGITISDFDDPQFRWAPLRCYEDEEGQRHNAKQERRAVLKTIRELLKLDEVITVKVDDDAEGQGDDLSNDSAASRGLKKGKAKGNLGQAPRKSHLEYDSLLHQVSKENSIIASMDTRWLTVANLEDVIKRFINVIGDNFLQRLLETGGYPSKGESNSRSPSSQFKGKDSLLKLYQPDASFNEKPIRQIDLKVKPKRKYDFRFEAPSSICERQLVAMILQGLTAASASDAFHLERLETMGDSFLKFVTSITLYLQCGHVHEGILHACRIKQISNFNLFRIAKNLGLCELVVAARFHPAINWLPPGFIIKEPFTADDPRKEMVEQVINDKSVADSVEALIGAFLLSMGPKKTLRFMKWLGLRVFNPDTEIASLPSPLIGYADRPSINPQEELESLTADLVYVEEVLGYKFKERAYLLQAMTHPSFFPNRITDCYQRLEFLGDSVLDYLVTFHIYENSRHLTPGQLTDLRSALVCNEMFAKFVVELNLHKKLKHMSPGLFYKNDVYAEKIKEGQMSPHRTAWTNTDVPEEIEVPKILGDIFESLAGAVFLDSGFDLDTVWEVFYRIMKPEIDLFMDPIKVPKPPLRILWEQFGVCEWSPARIASENPKTVKVTLKVKINGRDCEFVGSGSNKVAARNAAAKMALKELTDHMDQVCND